MGTINTMVIPVVENSREGYKIRKVTVNCIQMEITKLKVPNFDFQSNFFMSKIIGIFLIFYSLIENSTTCITTGYLTLKCPKVNGSEGWKDQ